MYKWFIGVFLGIWFFSVAPLAAQEPLPLPRFASIKSDEANIRTGPGKRYPIKWQITRKNVPVEIISEFEQWRKIRDISGDEGWVHQAILSGARFVVVQNKPQMLRRSDSVSSRIIAKLEPGVQARLKRCTEQWCEVEMQETEGWVLRSGLWGLYAHEELGR